MTEPTPAPTATFIRKAAGTWIGDARLYRLSEPLDGFDYVVVSAVHSYGPPETYIFGSDDSGGETDWSDLPGSFQGAMDHARALEGAGYVTV